MTHPARSKRAALKAKATGELREWFVNVSYLALFLCAFAVYRALIRGELLDRGVYVRLGAALFTAAAIAKMVMLGGRLRLGEEERQRVPLIVRTMQLAIIYSAFVFVVTIFEKVFDGFLHGRRPSETLEMLAHLGWDEIAARTLVILLAFIPFFAFREFARRAGCDDTFTVIFRRGQD